jgi:hypothetical protein
MQVSLVEEEDSQSERADSEVAVDHGMKFVKDSDLDEERTDKIRTAVASFVVLPTFVIGYFEHQRIKLPQIKNFKVSSRVEQKLTKRQLLFLEK